MFQALQDLRFSIRRLWRRPLHVILTVGILTLGLTATVAVVTYINGFYQPFPGVDASGLYQLFGNTEESPYLPVSYLDFEDYAKSAKSFKGITASASNAASVRHTNETEVAFVEAVSGNFFSVLEVPTPAGQRDSTGRRRPRSAGCGRFIPCLVEPKLCRVQSSYQSDDLSKLPSLHRSGGLSTRVPGDPIELPS